MNNIAVIQQDIYGTREEFAAVLTDQSLNFDKEAGFAIQVLQGSDYALGIAMQNRQSVINAVTNVAAIGISLNPAKKQAYLVPRDGRICLDISYMGLMDLAIATGSIRWGQARVVHEHDHFELDGFDKQPVHRYAPFSKQRGEIVGVYVVVKTADGDYLTDTMSVDDVNAIRDRSSAWKAWVSKKKSCPWVTDWSEMAKKTVVKRASKYWPKNDRLRQAIHHLDTEGGEGLATTAQHQADPDLLPRLLKAVEAAPDADALAKVWKDGLAEVRPTNDQGLYNAFKAAVSQRGAVLRDEATRTETPPDDGKTIDEGVSQFAQEMDNAGDGHADH
ncbi:recombinase RecT [Orrella dioscoreae]|uniref:Recombinational DNA repair protein RecT (Prophage associated) n=1 Tax=Orrella dioscoreae TaxID=1851544 RepID=A0A1C3K1B8_9BURK|nr:recombinase RecT [Orrella dioscoreae]SBT25310.1 Recombinational DNA repair protein RecT (prophage associated) [Orrella dioscoreae]SOE49091.1 Recombinational DNA repair protein RecT (prophage associated) [Orrella dioscoreae]